MDRFDAVARRAGDRPPPFRSASVTATAARAGVMRSIRACSGRAARRHRAPRRAHVAARSSTSSAPGTLAVGIVRAPVSRARTDRVGAAGPGARRPRRRARRRTVSPMPPSSMSHDLDGEPVLVVDRSDAPTAHDEIETYCAVARRPAALGEPRSRCRSNGCSTWSPSAPASAGSTRGRSSRDVRAATWRCGRCARWRCTTSSGWRGGSATARLRPSTFVRVVLETCGS